MSLNINELEPRLLWKYFLKVCKIPHASKKEEELARYIVEFARERMLQVRTDKAGNILIEKQSVKGYENKPTVILQSHIDMVCEKNASSTHNFDTDPIRPFIDDGWLKAQGTTLGADDGIGVAAQLALLDSHDIAHGKIECLFTVDEETGLTGAFGLEPNFFEAKILLNLDSEDEGLVFIGCAGGMDTVGQLSVKIQNVAEPQKCVRISVGGLKGGHSGDDINKGLGNAVKIIARLANQILKKDNFELVNIGGGNLRNAIAREAFADILLLNGCTVNSVNNIIQSFVEEINIELSTIESDIKIELTEIVASEYFIVKQDSKRLINLLLSLPHGVIGMSHSIHGLVETSTNLASVKQTDEHVFEIATSQRSSAESLKRDIANHVASAFRLAGANYKHSIGYPGWNPNPNSKILQTAKEAYQTLYNKELIVGAIHAGLECGLFLEKYPNLDMISFGPTMKGVHSPDEKLEIASVQKFWDFLVQILKTV